MHRCHAYCGLLRSLCLVSSYDALYSPLERVVPKSKMNFKSNSSKTGYVCIGNHMILITICNK